jgi:TonB family protein
LDRSRETVLQRQATAPAVDEVRFSAPRPNGTAAATELKAATASQPAAMTDAYEILLHSLWADMAETVEPKPAKKKWPIFAGATASVVVILAAAMIPVLNQRRASSVKPLAAPAPTATVIQRPEDAAPQPSLSTLTMPAPTPRAMAPSEAQNSSDKARASGQKAGPSRAQAQMMNDQLYAPTRIHRAAAPTEPAPLPSGSFAAADIGGSGNNNAIGSVFGSAEQPRVQAVFPKVINVSSSVAFGLLIQKTPPVYPSIAKTTRTSGTVVLAATISKTGTVENLRVVRGPVMLRQSALDAVRTWRYKPYLINNQPAVIETTVDVIFSLAY